MNIYDNYGIKFSAGSVIKAAISNKDVNNGLVLDGLDIHQQDDLFLNYQ